MDNEEAVESLEVDFHQARAEEEALLEEDKE